MLISFNSKPKIDIGTSPHVPKPCFVLFSKRKIQPLCNSSSKHEDLKGQTNVITRMREALKLPHSIQGLVRSLSSKSSLPDLVHSAISPSSSGDSLSTSSSSLSMKEEVPKLKSVLKKSGKSEPDLRKCSTFSRKRNASFRSARLHHVQFSKSPSIHSTYSKFQYDRQTDQSATCLNLSLDVAGAIKDELNNYKMTEMQVHEESRKHTHYFE
ncbi:hypothetical protein INT44_001369 [Umbelopsis vinacea]|uniref:Uncharacterized protein n=1 Tax=Umbelopsis vinacea TaxID=44442 RepID=A0A8H7QB59_9FUNG|nr:hypothetical protein INT44_001369 [Umbelopsis vinacea]